MSLRTMQPDALRELEAGLVRLAGLHADLAPACREPYDQMLAGGLPATEENIARREALSSQIAEASRALAPLLAEFDVGGAAVPAAARARVKALREQMERQAAESRRFTSALVLVAGLSRLRDLYREMLAINTRQAEHTADADQETLFRILADKNRVMGEVAEVDKTTTPHFAEWERDRERHDPAVRDLVTSIRDETGAILAEVIALEDSNRQALESRRQTKVDEMRKVDRSRQVHRAYGQAQQPPDRTRYYDQSS
ncbi:MAG: hypothetical protein HY719_15005 [Planctomycetes bacterium]|nr:hypothetical protein [Planctomycetota bacterium]